LAAPMVIAELVERFNNYYDTYKSHKYNEAQVRQEFVDPFFKALGWDMENAQGFAEAYKEVIHEDSVKVGHSTKAPDYSFRIGGNRKFFLETKKPSVNLAEDPAPALQLRTYAWNAKLPVSIVMDFEEFVVYDCRFQPQKTDGPSKARLLYLTYKEYLEHWDEIAGIFSKDAILKGAFDKYAETTKSKRGTKEVDAAFLEEISSWREDLARNIAIRNQELSVEELNAAVQSTIDRIIFLRICEDRGVEKYEQLKGLLNGEAIYPKLCDLFIHADSRFNSGLFHFKEEQDRANPDLLTLKLQIDDKPLSKIISSLYPPGPYNFAVMPPEILGQVYEQFLGKVIRLTEGHHAKVEDKPEVKKAGGVFYTPSFIVEYIVKNTVGKLLEGKTPKMASSLRILDPACGSGSFLLGAYRYLLDWHLEWYSKAVLPFLEKGESETSPIIRNLLPFDYLTEDSNNEKRRGRKKKHRRVSNLPIYLGPGNIWRLTTEEKKRILLNNIYGVDIDPQAVEVTKLSLLLKVLEGESQETIQTLLRFSDERALPDLDNNIKCGNSLISFEFIEEHVGLSNEEIKQVNPFDWSNEFPEIMQNGGFDAVIGNPPYIPIEMIDDLQKTYFKRLYPQLERKYDSSIIFILAMLKKLNNNGLLGFISSLTWQTGENYRRLREYLFTNAGVVTLVNLPFDVFKNAYVDTGIYVLSYARTSGYNIYRFPKKQKSYNLENLKYIYIPKRLVIAPDYKIVLEPFAQNILLRALSDQRYAPLGKFTISTQGLAGNRFTERDNPPDDKFYPYLAEGKLHRYRLIRDRVAFVDLSEFSSLKPFYESQPKILIRRVISRQDRLMATFTDRRMVFKKDINPFIIIDPAWDPLFVLGIINSSVLSYLYVNTSSIATKDDFRQTTLAELRGVPIPRFDAEDPKCVEVSTLVQRLFNVYESLNEAKMPHEKEILQRQIEATDKQIDKLVCELYRLTEEEIKIVEESQN
jgi:hypothetical protein